MRASEKGAPYLEVLQQHELKVIEYALWHLLCYCIMKNSIVLIWLMVLSDRIVYK